MKNRKLLRVMSFMFALLLVASSASSKCYCCVELSEKVQSLIEKIRFYAILLHDNSGGRNGYKNIIGIAWTK